MAQAKDGDKVKVHYTGKLRDGSVFDSSENREPLEFTLGEGQLIPGFEKTVRGMSVGDKAVAEIAPEDAYGPRREEMMETVPRSEFPAHLEPEVGQMLRVSQPDGESLVVTIADVSEESVTLDANHPLAGKELIFDIELIEIA